MKDVMKLDVVRNNKNGKLYNVSGSATHSETLECMVIYYDEKGQMWVRPYDLFLEKFTLVQRLK